MFCLESLSNVSNQKKVIILYRSCQKNVISRRWHFFKCLLLYNSRNCALAAAAARGVDTSAAQNSVLTFYAGHKSGGSQTWPKQCRSPRSAPGPT